MRTKSRHNRNSVRLMRQVAESGDAYRKCGTPRIRTRMNDDIFSDMGWHDMPERSSGRIRNWKKFRKKQYKQRGQL